ncbi:hypothetical protein ACFVTP_15655 [Streptomyces celluloflavus]|uniref:hypothetical protein n=1 Tax=Streptomyces celluloflavus TaxID=58344 RepID=UPI0036DA591E
MGTKDKAQRAREQAESKLREERKKASQRSGRTGGKSEANDKAWQEKLRQQQAEQDRRDTFDENFEV